VPPLIVLVTSPAPAAPGPAGPGPSARPRPAPRSPATAAACRPTPITTSAPSATHSPNDGCAVTTPAAAAATAETRAGPHVLHGRVPEGAIYIGRGAPGLPASPYANPDPVRVHGLEASLRL
jgi:hypothetical protein